MCRRWHSPNTFPIMVQGQLFRIVGKIANHMLWCSSCTDRKLTTCNWLQFNILSVWNGQFSTVIILVHANNFAPLVLWFWIPLGGRWFSLRTLVSSTNKTDRQDIAEMLLKVALNTITVPQNNFEHYDFWWLLNMKVLIEIYQVLTVLVWFRSTIFNDPRTPPFPPITLWVHFM
jgi:hypothetical protein